MIDAATSPQYVTSDHKKVITCRRTEKDEIIINKRRDIRIAPYPRHPDSIAAFHPASISELKLAPGNDRVIGARVLGWKQNILIDID